MIVLDHLTTGELDPPALVIAAADAGYDAVSVWFNAPPGGEQPFQLIGDTDMRRRTIAIANERDIRIFNIGLFVLTPAGWQDHWEGMLASGAAMGARRAIVLHYDPDAERAQALLGRLAERAVDHGIGLDVEFIAGSGLTSLEAACALVRAVGGDTGIVLDPLHLRRTGGRPSDIGDAERNLTRYAQLCDGPAHMPPEKWLWEGSRQRKLPGDGHFQLTEFVAALPAGVPVGLEVPLEDFAATGIGPTDRAAAALRAARPWLDQLKR